MLSNTVFKKSKILKPHFEEINERKILFVDGYPYTILSAEIPWWDLIDGHYQETMHVYDYLYPAAKTLGLNTIKVPVKWAMVEPEQGKYDFSYVDHVKKMAEENGLKVVLGWFGHYASGDGNIYRNLTGEVFAPMYVIDDEERYPRAVDQDGIIHHNCASYDDHNIVEVEIAAFSAFMEHIKQIDEGTHTILMIQVENEIAVFGADRKNRKMWRDHSQLSNQKFKEQGFEDDLKYSAWSLTNNWLKPLTEVGQEKYEIPFFVNFVGGQLSDWMVGGSPGEDVATYLENCPAISFCGLNLYTQPGRSINDLRAAVDAYKVGRNMPSITEANSDMSSIGPRLAYLAIGEFAAPLFAPWALNVSYPTPYQPYVLEDGSIANGAQELKNCYNAINKAMIPVTYFAGTSKLKVFMSTQPGERFETTLDVNGAKITVSGRDNGQVIVINPGENEFILLGYRARVFIESEMVKWPELKKIRVEKGYWQQEEWITDGQCQYSFDQSKKTIGINLTTPQVIRIY